MKPSTRREIDRVEVKNLSRIFGRTYALNRVTTTFEAGHIIALLGPNGAGKSTLISLLGTLQRPDRGTITYGDYTLDEVVKHHRSIIGYVSHDALLYADLSGEENLRFYAKLYQVEKGPQRCAEMIERVGLSHAAKKVVHSYSRGMRQRLSIARALLQKPALLLLDEPFTGIDQQGLTQLFDIFEEEKAAGRILLLSTHRLELPLGLVDDVRILERGRLKEDRPLGPNEGLDAAYAAAFRQSE